MIRRPPGSKLTDTLFPYTTLFRSPVGALAVSQIVYAGGRSPHTFPELHPSRRQSRRHTALRQPGRSLSRGLLPSRWRALSSKADRGNRRPFRRHPDVVDSLTATPPSEHNLSIRNLGVSMSDSRARLYRGDNPFPIGHPTQ